MHNMASFQAPRGPPRTEPGLRPFCPPFTSTNYKSSEHYGLIFSQEMTPLGKLSSTSVRAVLSSWS